MLELLGKRVLISGGDGGIGLALVHGFLHAGCLVTIVSERENVADTAATIGSEVDAVRCDVRDGGALRDALAAKGPVDIAIGNAGVGLPTPLSGGAEAAEAFALNLAVNLTGNFHFAQAVAPLLPDGGRLIFTSSNQAKLGYPGFAGYIASKHGLTGMVRSLAFELGPRNITVNAVCPNVVRTGILEQAAALAGTTAEELSAHLVAGQALPGRITEPDEIVGTYLFLASPLAALITGQTISADRGSTMS